MSKTILVTGASAGIGKATAELLLKDGFTVYVAARRVEKMADLERLGAKPIAMDITNDDQVAAAVERIKEETGGVDILVNNAGFGMYGSVEETSIEDARYQFEVNLFGLARLTQLVLPHMRAMRSGKIINVSSVGGKVYTPLGAWYHATKHALEGWSDSLRLELAQFGIDVVIIQPGAIKTEFGDVMIAPMLERSGSGPYGALANKMAEANDRVHQNGNSSPPSVIANVIAKSIYAERPKTRYAAGKYAKPLLFVRKLGDRTYDKTLMKQFKLNPAK